ncbi:circadian clock-controlled protein-like [Hyposmocoma kahamanoa]|uniref:circadian clock-controlled protein-like n=1 Tax=Hyposmocoma kahamanoa TaxID=1477025 RepID=UPI000E6D83E8|nr:circadian clock-controlled protein-like [Hyposmocoma kahamanoa]
MAQFKIISLFCLALCANGAQLPSFLTPCSQSLPVEELSNCITAQARNSQKVFAKGIPQLTDPLDPLTLNNVSAVAGTFSIKSTNVIVKGLRKMEIKEMRYDLQKLSGHTKVFGNLSFTSDYETEGRVLLLPITGSGKLAVKMYNTDVLIKFKIRKVQGPDGAEHMETYDLKTSQQYGNVKIHMSNILGGNAIGDGINHVLNENWRDLMTEVGPPFIEAVSAKVHDVINQLYKQVPINELFTP